MSRPFRLLLAMLFLVASRLPVLCAQEDGFAVEKGRFRHVLERPGVILPVDVTEIVLVPEAFDGDFRVRKILPHGAPVKSGDVLVEFDARRIDEKIRDVEFELSQMSARLEMALAESALAAAAAERDVAKAAFESAEADRKLAEFQGYEKSRRLRNAEQSEKNAVWGVEDQREELAQLGKMYAEDELTNPTEQIVLKRAEREVARAEFHLQMFRESLAHEREVEEPIRQKALEMEAAHRKDGLARARKAAELRAKEQELRDAKSKRDIDLRRTELERLRRDRELFALRAPAAGVCLHGSLETYRPGTQPKRVKPGGTIGAREAFLLVATSNTVRVQFDTPGDFAASLTPDTAVDVQLGALPRLAGRVSVVESFAGPRSTDSVDLHEVLCDLGPEAAGLPPGARVKVSVILADLAEALTVPVAAVRRDATGIWVITGDEARDKRRRVAVEVGPSDGTKIVIRSGLSANDRVYLTM